MAVLRNLKQDAELDALRAEIARLKDGHSPKTLSFKRGDKGGLSVYGMGRFPVTLYYEQWLMLLDHKEVILDWLESNKANLKTRDQ